MNNVFEQLRRLTNETEATVIGLVAATIPWLAPIIPAYIAYENMRHVLLFAPWLSFVGAVVVEFLGLSAVHTAIQFWGYNRSRRKIDEAAPVYIAIGVGVFYLAIILVVNVILDEAPVEQLAAKALLSLISVPAGITLAIRAQHSGQLLQVEAEKRERRQGRLPQPLSTATVVNQAQPQLRMVDTAVRTPKTVDDLTPAQRRIYEAMQQKPGASLTEIGQQLGISRQAVSKQVKQMNGVARQ